MNEYEEVLNSLKKGTKIYTDTRIDNAPYDKTTTGKIVGSSDDGYDVEINKQVYNNIPTIGGTCTLNEMVKVVIPQNNESNMFILKTESGSGNYEQLVNSVALSDSDNLDWFNIDNKPTTVSGYGITDVYTKTEVDDKIASIIKLIEDLQSKGNNSDKE